MYILLQAAHQQCSVDFDNNLGLRGTMAPQILCHTPPALQTLAAAAREAALPSLIMSSVSSKIVWCGQVPDSLEVRSTAGLLTPTGQQLRS